jgi:hypothetical protein
MVQVVEHLPSKHKALRSNASTTQNKQKNNCQIKINASAFLLKIMIFF